MLVMINVRVNNFNLLLSEGCAGTQVVSAATAVVSGVTPWDQVTSFAKSFPGFALISSEWGIAACEDGGDAVRVENVVVQLSDNCKRTTVIGLRESAANAQTFRAGAKLLVFTGAGWTKQQAGGQAHILEAEKLIREFLQVGRASLGSNKSLMGQNGVGRPDRRFYRT